MDNIWSEYPKIGPGKQPNVPVTLTKDIKFIPNNVQLCPAN